MSDNENIAIKILQDNIIQLQNYINHRLDIIEDKIDDIITRDECKKNRRNCLESLTLKRTELSIKKIVAIGGVVTGTVAASSTIVVTIVKILNPI